MYTNGNLKFQELGNFGTWELEVPGTSEHGNFGTWELRNLGTSELALGCLAACPAGCFSPLNVGDIVSMPLSLGKALCPHVLHYKNEYLVGQSWHCVR